ncbi:MAG: hypothetical protein ACYSUN_11140 [Planctomycetota bacterium]
MDPTDSYRHVIRVQGLTNSAVFGADGVCVFNGNGIGPNIKSFRKVIDSALRKAKSENRRAQAFEEYGTVYAPQVREQGRIVHERMASIAVSPDGKIHVAYVSDESGTDDLFLMSSDGREWSDPIPVAATLHDEYAPCVAAPGDDEVLITYCSNRKGKRYEIWAVQVVGDTPKKPKQVSRSKDDAMAPSVAWDGKHAWLAWYEWKKMGDLSRDREIFLSRGKGGAWSKPIQVSPKNVSAYEDHADPVVQPDGKGGAWVAWAWDYHGVLPSKPPVNENSVFVLHLDRRLKAGPPLAAGFRGEGSARDYAPTLAVTPDGVPWTAWDNCHKSSAGYSAKGLFVNRLRGDDFGPQFEAGACAGAVCSPRLLVDPSGRVHLLWAQRGDAGWELRLRGLTADGPGEMRGLKVAGKSPRYPAGVFAPDGSLWVAYTDISGKHWRVHAEKMQ